MAQYILLNLTRLRANGVIQTLLPGTVLDDTTDDVAGVQASGGRTWPATDATVAAAATEARDARRNRGMSEQEMANVLAAAVAESQSITQAASNEAVLQTNFQAPAAAGTAVHAQAAAGAPLNLTTAFTIPFPRRSLEVVLGTSGANPLHVHVRGTAPGGAAQSLDQSLVGGAGTYELGGGAMCWETITSVTTDEDPGGTFDLKTGTGISVGQPVESFDALGVDGVTEAIAASHIASGGFKPTTAFNGTHNYAVRAKVGLT